MAQPQTSARDSKYPITRLPRYQIQTAVLIAGLAAALLWLAAGLRPDAFYSGDPGVKLIAVRSIIEHPSRPFEVSLPTLGGQPVPYVEPFFRVDGTHAHAITSPVFPILSAPIFLALGFEGLYVIPALGFLLAVAGSAWIAVALDERRTALIAAIAAAAGTPWIFYGLEFWEHAPAVGLAAAGLALYLRGRHVLAGLAFGAAMLLRPEAAWFAAAALLSSPLLTVRPRIGQIARTLGGTLAALAPFEAYVVLHFGTLVPLHVSSNVGGLAQGWLAGRLPLLSLWFVQATDASFWRVAPVVAAALVTLALASRRRGTAFLWAVAAIDVLAVVATAPNDGGAQWGPRYLLFAYVPLAVLAADAVDALPPKRIGTALAVTAVLAGAIWIQRSGYRQLQSTKLAYGRIADFVAAEAEPGSHVVTDLWWLDQIAAATLDRRQILYASSQEAGNEIVRRLSDLGTRQTTVIRSGSESLDLRSWNQGTCFVEERRNKTSTRDLVAIRLRNNCPR